MTLIIAPPNQELPKLSTVTPSIMDEPLLYKVALSCIPKVGAMTARQLISYSGGVEAIFKSKPRELMKIPGIGPQLASNITGGIPLQRAEKQLDLMDRHGIKAIFLFDEEYPERLKHIPDSPILLFYKGTVSLNHHRTVAIVGTRKPTHHGVSICEELVEQLAGYNAHIISGLAYGIDITAHRKSLECKVPTIGVLAHGLHQIYPSVHRKIAAEMLEHGGLLTEYPHGVNAEKEFFPMRNRIVAGLCDALIVIETAKRGGSMITAELANGYSRDVFAIPGRIRDTMSAGCNLLIRNNKAALIESAKDIADFMRWDDIDQRRAIQQQLFVDLEPAEQKIVDLLKENDEMSIDQLTYASDMSSSHLATLLLTLEFKGLVKSLPGKRYILILT